MCFGKSVIITPQLDPQNLKRAMKIYHLKYNKLSERLLGYVRAISFAGKAYESHQIAVDVEIFVVQQTRQLIKEIIDNYPTSLEEDEGMLEGAGDMKLVCALSNG